MRHTDLGVAASPLRYLAQRRSCVARVLVLMLASARMAKQVLQRFVEYGTNFESADGLRGCDGPDGEGEKSLKKYLLCANELAVDVGGCCWGHAGETRRVLDHHFDRQEGNFPCASAAVMHSAEAIAAWAEGLSSDVVWIVSHKEPDFDALAAITLVEWIVEHGAPQFQGQSPLPAAGWHPTGSPERLFNWYDPQPRLQGSAMGGEEWLFQVAGLAALTDQCKRLKVPLLRSVPGYLYAAQHRGRWFGDTEGVERRKFFDAVRDAVRAGGNALTDCLLEGTAEYAAERTCLAHQQEAYERDMQRARKAVVNLPVNQGFARWYQDVKESPLLEEDDRLRQPLRRAALRPADGLYLRDPECILFKNLARLDTAHSPKGGGFEFLAIVYSGAVAGGKENTADYWFSLDPERAEGAHLYPIWERLQQAEVKERRERGWKPDGEARPGFEKRAGGTPGLFADPWFDGGSYQATLVRNPSKGTCLRAEGVRDDLQDDRVVQVVRELLEGWHLAGKEGVERVGGVEWRTVGLMGDARVNDPALAAEVGKELWRRMHPRQTLPTDFFERHLVYDEDIVACWSRTGMALAYQQTEAGEKKRDACRQALARLQDLKSRAQNILGDLQKAEGAEQGAGHQEAGAEAGKPKPGTMMEESRQLLYKMGQLKWELSSSPDVRVVGRYFAALDLERQMTVLHEVIDARTAGQSLDKVVELQEHAGLLEILILGVYAAEIAHLFTATAHETHFEGTLVYLVLAPVVLGGTVFLCRETKRWRLWGPVAAAIVVVVCGVGLSVLAHGAKEQKLRQESQAREKAATEERSRLDKKQTERDERMWQEVGRLREEVRQLGGKRSRSQAKR